LRFIDLPAPGCAAYVEHDRCTIVAFHDWFLLREAEPIAAPSGASQKKLAAQGDQLTDGSSVNRPRASPAIAPFGQLELGSVASIAAVIKPELTMSPLEARTASVSWAVLAAVRDAISRAIGAKSRGILSFFRVAP